jgi:hypothetical protein
VTPATRRRGQADGDLRDDVTSSDVLMVLLAVGPIGEGTADTSRASARRTRGGRRRRAVAP